MSRHVAIVAAILLASLASAVNTTAAPGTMAPNATMAPPNTTEAPTTPAPVETFDGCTGSNPNGENSTMSYFTGNTSVTVPHGAENTSVTFALSPCAMTNFSGCAYPGYIARYSENGRTCQAVFNQKHPTSYNPNTKTFITVYSDNGAGQGMAIGDTITLRVTCAQLQDSDTGRLSNGDELIYANEKVCPGYTPPATSAPQAPEEKKGLSTGAIVGIVIGALAILVIVLVIFRWKAQKGEEEGEYQRV